MILTLLSQTGYFLIEYMSYFVAAIIQIIFILLPVNLKNWDDDALNSLAYIAFQLFVAGMIFIVMPWVLESKHISTWTECVLIGSIGCVALIRVLKLIPLEFTYPTKLEILTSERVIFEGFPTQERYSYLYSLNFQDSDAESRYNAFREKIIRLKVETVNRRREEEDDDTFSTENY